MNNERLSEKETNPQIFTRRILKEHPVGSKEYQDLIKDLVWFQDIESALRSEDFNEQHRGQQALQDESDNIRHMRLAAEYGVELTSEELEQLIENLKQHQIT
jgi:hypothetical protein